MSFVFFGRGGLLSSIVLSELCRQGYAPKLVIIEEKKETNYPNLLTRVCADNGLELVKTDNPNSTAIENILEITRPDFCVVAGFATILKSNILRVCKFYNIHPGLLPKYRGADPIFWAVRNNEDVFGVTCHEMTEQIDVGNHMLSRETDLTQAIDSCQLFSSVYRSCGNVAVELVKSYRLGTKLVNLENKKIIENHYYPKPKIEDFEINPKWDVNFMYKFSNRVQMRGKPWFGLSTGKIYVSRANILYCPHLGKRTDNYEIKKVSDSSYIIENDTGVIELVG